MMHDLPEGQTQHDQKADGAESLSTAGFETAADDLCMFASQIREAMKGEGDLPHPWTLDDWLVDYRDRFDRRRKVSNDELAVLDGYCSATSESRTDVIRELLAAWSEKKFHEATVIMRVAGRHPILSECDRSPAGVPPAKRAG